VRDQMVVQVLRGTVMTIEGKTSQLVRGEVSSSSAGRLDVRLAAGEPERRREDDLELGDERRPLRVGEDLLSLWQRARDRHRRSSQA
jgi:hypothetical protein